MDNFIFPSGIFQDLSAKNKDWDRGRAGTPTSLLDSKKKTQKTNHCFGYNCLYLCQQFKPHVTKDAPKLKCFKVLSIKGHFMLLKAFWKSMKSRRPGICFVFAYLMMLSMILIFSPIVLFCRKAVWSLLLIFGRTFLMRLAIDLVAIS